MPFDLLIAWSLLLGFANTHQRHALNFRGESQALLLAIQLSALLASVVAVALLVYYFAQVTWYWPIILFVIGSVVGAVFFGLLDYIIGQPVMSMVAFIGWPAAAVWCFNIIQRIHS